MDRKPPEKKPPPGGPEEAARRSRQKDRHDRASRLESERRAAELGGALDLHRALRKRLEEAVPLMRSAADAVSRSSKAGSAPEPLGVVLRDFARRFQQASAEWNSHEDSFESFSAEERSARDEASATVEDLLTVVSDAARLQLALERSSTRNASNRAARTHVKLQVRELGRVVAGSAEAAQRLLRTLSASSPGKYEDLIETVSDPNHPG